MRPRRLMESAIDLRGLLDGSVERGPNGAPLAFRIWSAGKTTTDKGEQFFTERSADLLLAQQTVRGNLFSIDVDHLSLSKIAPPESRKAVGWHRLEVRRDAKGAAELWAVGVQWTDVAQSGLVKEPPEWRYFSPAYEVDQKTSEVIGYLNTALTNNPATWGVTALASGAQGEVVTMTRREMISAFKHMASGESPEAKAAAAVVAMLESGKMPDGDEPAKDDDDKEKKTAEDPPPAKKKDDDKKDDDDDEKKKKEREAGAATEAELTLAAKVQELTARLNARDEAEERAKLMATRADLDPEVAKVLARAPIATVKELLPKLPKTASRGTVEASRAALEVTATRGKEQGEGGASVERVGYSLEALDEAMGLRTATNQIKHEGTRMFLGVMTPAQARAKLAAEEANTAKGGR